jgi:hypothetical protein
MPRFNFLPASTHSSRLERWLGKECVDSISKSMRGYHGTKPIAIANVPGHIYATNDGDFVGGIKGGYFTTFFELCLGRLNKAVKKIANGDRLYTGFSSLSDLISEATTGGKKQQFMIAKTGVTGVANIANSLWDVGANPQAGGTSAAAAGSSPDNTTNGSIRYTNPTGGDTMHFIGATMVPTVGANCLLMYDRFYQVNHNIANDPQSISGTPTRYQSNAAINTFLTAFVTTALGAGTPTLTLTYVDDAGNTAENATTQTIVGSAIARRFPFAATIGNGWFIPLNSGDRGVRSLTNADLSATSTGNIDYVLGKPYVWIPQGIANFPIIVDGINSAFNLVQITDSSCLAFMEINKGATTATSYSGTITLCAG